MRNPFSRSITAGLAVLVGLSALGTGISMLPSQKAVALTSPATVAMRRVPWQTTTHYRFTVNWNDGNIGAGIKIGAVPLKAFVDSVKCNVTTAFNAATLNYLGIATTQAGTAVGAGDWVNGATGTTSSCVLATLGYQNLTTAVSLGQATTPQAATAGTGSSGGYDIWVRYYQTGAAATAGQATVVFTYVPDDDM